MSKRALLVEVCWDCFSLQNQWKIKVFVKKGPSIGSMLGTLSKKCKIQMAPHEEAEMLRWLAHNDRKPQTDAGLTSFSLTSRSAQMLRWLPFRDHDALNRDAVATVSSHPMKKPKAFVGWHFVTASCKPTSR